MNQAIVDKVIKLLALAEDKNAQPGEVENAKKMAAKLMTKHQIDIMDELQASSSRNLFIRFSVETGRKTYLKEDTLLLHIVCIFSGVSLLTSRRTAKYTFVGRESDIESMLYMYDILTTQRDRQCPKGQTAKYRQTWKNGFAFGVQDQLNELTKRVQDGVTERGLVPVSVADQALQWYNENVCKTGKARNAKYDSNYEGYQAGKNASIHKGVAAQETVKQIG